MNRRIVLNVFIIFISLATAIEARGAGNVVRYLEPETVSYCTRVLADGGSIVNQFDVNESYKHAKMNGYYSSLNTWYSSTFGVYKDSVGAVSKLYDLSSKGYDATQGTGANQPMWILSQRNGRPGIKFSGSPMVLSTVFVPLATESIVIVVHPTVSGQIAYGARDSTNYRAYAGVNGTTPWHFAAGVATQNFSTIIGTADVTGSADIGILTYNGSVVNLYTNGVSDYSAPQSGSVNNTVRGYSIGAENNAGTPGSYWVGNIYEIMCLSTILSTESRNALNSFLNTKWAVY